VSKKERVQRAFERLKQLIAAQESKARADSQARQERIKVLWDEIRAELARDAKELADDELDRSLIELVQADPELVRSLMELVSLHKGEIEYLTQFRRKWEQILAYDREGLENLYNKSRQALVQPAINKLTKEEKPEAKYERKRRTYTWSDVGEIEREFGDARAAWWQTNPFLAPLIAGPPPTCLDEIFAGDRVDMATLQELFGMHRNRFQSLKLRSFKDGTKRLYDYRAVVKIMRALSEKPGERKGPGRPLRTWLSKPDLRARLFSRIEWRINYVRARPKIARAFLTLIHRPGDSAKK
jgi:hypothetical protein